MTAAAEIGAVPSDSIGAFSLIFYSTPQEAVKKRWVLSEHVGDWQVQGAPSD